MTKDSNTNEFYVTFGQKYRRQQHPQAINNSYPHPDGYLTVIAGNYDEARAAVYQVLGILWAFLYSQGTFDRSLYPLGELGRIIAADLPAVA